MANLIRRDDIASPFSLLERDPFSLMRDLVRGPPFRQISPFYAYERSYGSFSRSFTLPEGIDDANIRTELRSGC